MNRIAEKAYGESSAAQPAPEAAAESPNARDAVTVAHTPGPWDWFSSGLGNNRIKTRAGMKFFIGSNGQGFAHTVGLGPDEDEANAKLIAAAPDLLAVAIAATKGLNIDELSAMASAAIARAMA